MKLILLFLICFSSTSFAENTSKETYTRYFKDTFQSLEAMRNKETGLLKDATKVDNSTHFDPTSPTNMGLDAMVQMEALKYPELKEKALLNLRRSLNTMKNLDYHEESGMFYNRYKTDDKKVDQKAVSTVDNINLTMSLWVLSQTCPDPEAKKTAKELFGRMNYNKLYDKEKGLFYAGATFDKEGKFVLDGWHYDYLGSEARSLYSMGHALNLVDDKDFLKKAIPNLKVEMDGPMLKLWDGGAFQLLLPRLFVNEELYSEKLKESFLAYGNYILQEGKKHGYRTPAAFSASQACEVEYNGMSGSPGLVATSNPHLKDPSKRNRWDAVYTPHAAILAASSMPESFVDVLKATESLGKNGPLYRPGLGWLDGYTVKGEQEGMVVPIFLSLDQSMIALSLSQMLADDGMTIANRAFRDNPDVKEKLIEYYKEIDNKISQPTGK